MTEEEAKTKICPLMLINATNLMIDLAGNDDAIDHAGKTAFCIASDCMLWQWNCGKRWRKRRDDGQMRRISESGRDIGVAEGGCGLKNEPPR